MARRSSRSAPVRRRPTLTTRLRREDQSGGLPPPSFIVQPSVSPSTGSVGQTFLANNGLALNAATYTRRWLLSGTAIGTGTTVTPVVAGSLVLEVKATGAGGTTVATSPAVTVNAAPGPVTLLPYVVPAPTTLPAQNDTGYKEAGAAIHLAGFNIPLGQQGYRIQIAAADSNNYMEYGIGGYGGSEPCDIKVGGANAGSTNSGGWTCADNARVEARIDLDGKGASLYVAGSRVGGNALPAELRGNTKIRIKGTGGAAIPGLSYGPVSTRLQILKAELVGNFIEFDVAYSMGLISDPVPTGWTFTMSGSPTVFDTVIVSSSQAGRAHLRSAQAYAPGLSGQSKAMTLTQKNDNTVSATSDAIAFPAKTALGTNLIAMGGTEPSPIMTDIGDQLMPAGYEAAFDYSGACNFNGSKQGTFGLPVEPGVQLEIKWDGQGTAAPAFMGPSELMRDGVAVDANTYRFYSWARYADNVPSSIYPGPNADGTWSGRINITNNGGVGTPNTMRNIRIRKVGDTRTQKGTAQWVNDMSPYPLGYRDMDLCRRNDLGWYIKPNDGGNWYSDPFTWALQQQCTKGAPLSYGKTPQKELPLDVKLMGCDMGWSSELTIPLNATTEWTVEVYREARRRLNLAGGSAKTIWMEVHNEFANTIFGATYAHINEGWARGYTGQTEEVAVKMGNYLTKKHGDALKAEFPADWSAGLIRMVRANLGAPGKASTLFGSGNIAAGDLDPDCIHDVFTATYYGQGQMGTAENPLTTMQQVRDALMIDAIAIMNVAADAANVARSHGKGIGVYEGFRSHWYRGGPEISEQLYSDAHSDKYCMYDIVLYMLRRWRDQIGGPIFAFTQYGGFWGNQVYPGQPMPASSFNGQSRAWPAAAFRDFVLESA